MTRPTKHSRAAFTQRQRIGNRIGEDAFMPKALGIRREDKNIWERRVPVTPEQVERLVRDHGVEVVVQPSTLRAFPDATYGEAGARLREDLSECGVIAGVKEMPMDVFQPGKAYLFFSHTVKGQPYNMPMLRRMMERGCHLIDYERIVDASGRRLVLFGRFAAWWKPSTPWDRG